MSVNLLDVLKDQIGDSIANQASSFLGEQPKQVESAMSGIIPSLFGTLINKGADESGAKGLMDLISNGGFDGGLLDNLGGLFNGGESTSNLLNSGGGLLDALLGSKTSGLIDMISGFAGIKKSSSGSLLKMAAPMIMSLLGRQVKKNGLNAGGLMSLLLGQKDHVKAAMPEGLAGVGNLLGFASGFGKDVRDAGGRIVEGATGAATAATGAATAAAGAATAKAKSSTKWLLPLLLAAAAIALLFFLMKGCDADKATETLSDAAGSVIDKAEDAGEAIADAGESVVDAAEGALDATTDAARKALANIKFAAGSAGEKLNTVLSSNGSSDEIIRFKNLKFETGSAAIVGETRMEVDNMAAVLKAYPNVSIEIHGYTDNTGEADRNKALSQARAEAVKNRLVELGIAENRMRAVGYGSENPVASNDTAEGREQNRRIEVKVVR